MLDSLPACPNLHLKYCLSSGGGWFPRRQRGDGRKGRFWGQRPSRNPWRRWTWGFQRPDGSSRRSWPIWYSRGEGLLLQWLFNIPKTSLHVIQTYCIYFITYVKLTVLFFLCTFKGKLGVPGLPGYPGRLGPKVKHIDWNLCKPLKSPASSATSRMVCLFRVLMGSLVCKVQVEKRGRKYVLLFIQSILWNVIFCHTSHLIIILHSPGSCWSSWRSRPEGSKCGCLATFCTIFIEAKLRVVKNINLTKKKTSAKHAWNLKVIYTLWMCFNL